MSISFNASKIVHVLRPGKLDYLKAVKLQQSIAAKFDKSKENLFRNVLILTEHNPVYTIGIRSKDYTDIDAEKLRELGAEFHKTNRGGLITFHGPGQLVAYPIIHLKHFQPSLRWYVCHIEKTIIDVCRKFGINAHTSPDTGVWVEDRKICAIGLHCSRYITTHGLALNCRTDLKWFEHIVPCGVQGKGVTSLSAELNKPVSIEEATPELLDSFKRIFKCEINEIGKDETAGYLRKIN